MQINKNKATNILVIILFLALLIGTSYMRLQNLPLLKDQTTNESLPADLDTFYFLRLAETIAEQGSLPEIDTMRYPSLNVPFSQEILPKAVVLFWKIGKTFNSDLTLRFVDVITPVIFFILGLIAFFFLIRILTKSNITALISSIFLAIIPSYLYRTMAGVPDHDVVGMFAFFLALLVFTIAIKSLRETDLKRTIGLGLLTGLVTTFAISSWGGIALFLFLIIPASFFIFWILSDKHLKYILFYATWLISSVLFGFLLNYDVISIINRYIISAEGLLGLFTLGFMIIDFLITTGQTTLDQVKKYVESQGK